MVAKAVKEHTLADGRRPKVWTLHGRALSPCLCVCARQRVREREIERARSHYVQPFSLDGAMVWYSMVERYWAMFNLAYMRGTQQYAL